MLLYAYRSFKTQQLMTSQIRSYIEYLMQTYNIRVVILYLKLVKTSSVTVGFIYDLMVLDSGLLLGPPCKYHTYIWSLFQSLTLEIYQQYA